MDLFCQLQERLLLELRSRVRRGETTERQLARTTGVSQPHMHNVLNGFRDLTPATADRILSALRLSIIDLIDIVDLEQALVDRPQQLERPFELVMLADRVGRGCPWPTQESRYERLTVSEDAVIGMMHPVAFRLAPDASMKAAFGGRDVAVADLGREARLDLPEALYLIARDGEAAIRWVRFGRQCVYLITAATLNFPARWEPVPFADYAPEKLILSKISFVNWRPELSSRLRRPGKFQGPARHSLAS